jgi:hypothetical protein
VAPSKSVTIQPGVTIRVASQLLLSVRGTLIGRRTAVSKILFTSNVIPVSRGYWGGIEFLETAVDATCSAIGAWTGGSVLEDVIVEAREALPPASEPISTSSMRSRCSTPSRCEKHRDRKQHRSELWCGCGRRSVAVWVSNAGSSADIYDNSDSNRSIGFVIVP